ncbi:CRE-HOG-1 protein [Caenorhabditis remanei]|uniref:CRE-HOG-1 protein n=1 Tax=Caenorhabditis remanei TaxID=31234 RepID=E3LDU0_CAERE|nr:CRE-HOG-1 protein [Caenorhabditis remanei]
MKKMWFFLSVFCLSFSGISCNSLLDVARYAIHEFKLPSFSDTDGHACFSTDSWMTTPTGKKRMDQVAIGDLVLTGNLTATYYTPIISWMHREPDNRYNFVTIMTEYGKMLAVSAKHLVYRNLCDENYAEYVRYLPKGRDVVFAEDLKIGDCLVLLYKGKYRQQRVMRISITERKGIFAPITENGRIIVNDIVASVYSGIKHTRLQGQFYGNVAYFQSWMRLFGESVFNQVSVPIGSALASDLLRLVVP